MGDHLNIEWSPIFLWRRKIMKNKFKSVICLLLAMVLAITTVVSTAPTEIQAAPTRIQLKQGAKVFCKGVKTSSGDYPAVGVIDKAYTNGGRLKFNISVKVSDRGGSHTLNICNITPCGYIPDLHTEVSDAEHKPGFQVGFYIGSESDSILMYDLINKAYIYLDDIASKDIVCGNSKVYVTNDEKTQLYDTSGKSAFGKVHRGFEFRPKAICIRNKTAYYKFTKKMKNRRSGKVKRITALIKIDDTL